MAVFASRKHQNLRLAEKTSKFCQVPNPAPIARLTKFRCRHIHPVDRASPRVHDRTTDTCRPAPSHAQDSRCIVRRMPRSTRRDRRNHHIVRFRSQRREQRHDRPTCGQHEIRRTRSLCRASIAKRGQSRLALIPLCNRGCGFVRRVNTGDHGCGRKQHKAAQSDQCGKSNFHHVVLFKMHLAPDNRITAPTPIAQRSGRPAPTDARPSLSLPPPRRASGPARHLAPSHGDPRTRTTGSAHQGLYESFRTTT